MGDPPALAALEWLRARMWDDQVMARPLDVQNVPVSRAFIMENVATVEDGSWALKDILSGANFRVGVAPLPAGPTRRVTLATTDGFAIYKGTRHPDAAWELLKFLISKDYGRAMAQANFLQPARLSLLDDWVSIIRQEFPAQTRDLDLTVFAQGHMQGYSVVSEIFPNMTEAVPLVYSAWEKIFILGEQPVDLLKQVSLQVEQAQVTHAP
jgi:multiple sugar transport system substrate-binding protein